MTQKTFLPVGVQSSPVSYTPTWVKDLATDIFKINSLSDLYISLTGSSLSSSNQLELPKKRLRFNEPSSPCPSIPGEAPPPIESAFCKRRKTIKPILKNISIYFNPGQLVAIMGPSGSGKTTFMELLTGRRKVDGQADIELQVSL